MNAFLLQSLANYLDSQNSTFFNPKTITTTVPLRDPDQSAHSSNERSVHFKDGTSSSAPSFDFFAMSDIEALENEYQNIVEKEILVKETGGSHSYYDNEAGQTEKHTPLLEFEQSPIRQSHHEVLRRPPPQARNSPPRVSRINSNRATISQIPEHAKNVPSPPSSNFPTHELRKSPRKSPSPQIESVPVKHTRINDEKDSEDSENLHDENETESEYLSGDLAEEYEISDEASDSFKTANNTTLQDKLSFSLSELEEEGENIALGLFKAIYRWVRGIFSFIFFVTKSMFRQLFITLFKNGLLIRVALFGLLLSFSVFLVAKINPDVLSLAPRHDIFEHSNLPPGTLDELSSRLMTVEKEITSLSRLSSEFKESSHSVNAIREQLDVIVGRIDTLSASHSATNKQLLDSAREIKVFDASLSDIEKLLKETKAAIESETQHGERLEMELAGNHETISVLSESIERANDEVEKLKKRVKLLESAENAEKYILETLDKHLPSRLVVKFDPKTGSINAAPEFWKFLSTQLALRNIISSPDTDASRQKVSFEEFLLHNQQAIDDYMNDYLTKNANPETKKSAVVSKEVFKEMFEKELASFKEDTVEELERLDQKLDRVKAIADRKQAPRVPIQTPDINGTEAALEFLIKSAIRKQVTHTISKPDFADPAFGARIIPSLTSRSYNWRDGLDFADRQLHKFLGVLGFGRMQVNGPLTAFNNDMALRACWPFNGHIGQVGVSLGTLVDPSDIGVVHVGARESPNPSSAPRKISLWVQVNDVDLRAKVSKLLDQTRDSENGEPPRFAVPPVPADFVKILSTEYDLYGGDEFQVFSVPLQIRRLGLVTSKVIFRIESNWGNSEYTCIYRLRLFGERVDPIEEEEDFFEESSDDGFFMNEKPEYSIGDNSAEDVSLGDDQAL